MNINKVSVAPSFVIFLLLLSTLCWAGGSKDKDEQSQTQQSVPVVISSPPPASVYWIGDGGKGIRLAVLEPTGKGLSATEQHIPSMIQSSITGDFNRYSAMTIIDRQNLEKILGEQKQSLSGNYSDDDYISIGKLTNARYILAGSITKTASAYMLELAVTDVESGERKASYPPKAVSPFALENLSAIKEASTDLLGQLGVRLTEQGRRELNTAANTTQIQAETALAKGIAAERQGTVVEALSYYIQANDYNTGLAEATSRMNILTANISSGNIGQDTRNEITWRREWVARLRETEAFLANTLKEPQPFYIVYSTDIEKGKINWEKETIEISIRIFSYPDIAWSDRINGTLTAVKNGLRATGRAETWELDWPAKTLSTPSPFVNQIKSSNYTVVVEILNDEGKSIGRQTVRVPYGFEVKDTIVTPSRQWDGTVSFQAVDANLITDKLTIRIASIDGIAAENAANQKKISVMPEAEWEVLLRKNPAVKQNIPQYTPPPITYTPPPVTNTPKPVPSSQFNVGLAGGYSYNLLLGGGNTFGWDIATFGLNGGFYLSPNGKYTFLLLGDASLSVSAFGKISDAINFNYKIGGILTIVKKVQDRVEIGLGGGLAGGLLSYTDTEIIYLNSLRFPYISGSFGVGTSEMSGGIFYDHYFNNGFKIVFLVTRRFPYL